MATIEQLTGITAQHNEIVKRVSNGSLNPRLVRRLLQDIIEGKVPAMTNWSPPTWWRTPELQLERAHELWPGHQLPEPPEEFDPRTKSEVLLLHVPDSFDSLWDKVDALKGYSKFRWERLKSDEDSLRLAPNKREFTAPVWLAFDPLHAQGESPNSLMAQSDCAASEVFSALIQFPEWSLTWSTSAWAPNLSGYQLAYEGAWSDVPCIYRSNGNRRLELGARWANRKGGHWSSPSVREC